MKIRTINDLQDLIDKELGWRKKELISIKSNVVQSRKFAKNIAIRSGITLLYAHWEGAIKNIATYYLCFVSCRKIAYKDLKKNFLAISINRELREYKETNKATLHNKIINMLFDRMEETSNIPYEDIIKTNSNLNSNVFSEIMCTIGLDSSQYESSYTLIDEVLLNMRNKIAHGERLEEISLDEERFIEIYDIILNLINLFANQVSNAACLEEYKVTEGI
ncbi:hypothetical protein EV204_11734 [Tissierella praeacuta]|uniref:MAE_28990/MAE_18760 family HEPN-like nuclease n=1 Tax=Tissierella praeacuta TaxID=43131 RepID=UPI00104A53BD|nr:MAE_28990/MAE_18760 family HEPN-like nuclease [Tissierella praeacuta]TCU65642.1 hypothetical protein EV204_11734 [Tissierella praeacuta]